MGNLISSFISFFVTNEVAICSAEVTGLPILETQFKSLAGYIRGKFSFKSYGMSSPLGRVSLMKEEDAEQFKKQRNKLFLQDIHLFPFDLLYIFRMLTSYYVVNTSLQIIFCSAVFIAFLNKVS